ncbi:serine/threonine protein kinase [Micromonospora peucetia]|uniref:serine/threonine protein kinase n=1 Tax=Micromonospora peucetia TaxID=47871 RepID=UPI00224F7ADE|nr:serine/threonine protein kinase [Micromonospora peucetia]MCX4388051.1 serine/threonine protein kinase [Micromonospora peucetia]
MIPTLPDLGLEFLPLDPGDPDVVGDIRLLGRIGEGGMGRVYLGVTQAGRAVAVKVVKDPYSTDPSFRARFAREAAIASRVGGVFTAPVVSHDAEAVRPWLATAFVPGLNLAVAVARHGTLPLHGVWRLAAGVAEALKAIHAAGIVHRDLKPGNVLLAADGPRVIDFGISRADGERDLTQTGVRMGTPSYMAPEQLRGERSTPATDVFALGSVVAFTATGKAPFRASSDAELVYRVTQGEPTLDGITDPGLRELVSRCLAKDPQLRPTPQDVIAAYTDRSAAAAGQGWLPEGLEETLTQAENASTIPAGSSGVTLASTAMLTATDSIGPDRPTTVPDRRDTVAEPVAGKLTKLPDLTTHAMSPADTRRRKWRRPAVAGVIGVLMAILAGTYLANGDATSREPSPGSFPAGSSPTDAAVGATSSPTAAGASRPSKVPGATTTGASDGGPDAAPSPPSGPAPTRTDPGTPVPTKADPGTPVLPSGPFNPDNMVIVSSDGTVLSTNGTNDGSRVVTTAWRKLPGQSWKLESAGKVMVVKASPSKQLTIGHDGLGVLSPASSGNVFGWVYDSVKLQLHNGNSGGCLTSHGPGRQVTYGLCDSSQNQRWRIVS